MENSGTWVGIAALAISGLFAWLSRRDSLRNSIEVAALKNENVVLRAQVADCTQHRDECNDRLDKATVELVRRDERDKKELLGKLAKQQEKIEKLERRNISRDAGDPAGD